MKKKIEHIQLGYFDVADVLNGSIDEIRTRFNDVIDAIEENFEKRKLIDNLRDLKFEAHPGYDDYSTVSYFATKEETDEEFEKRMAKYKVRNIEKMERLIQRKAKLDQEVLDLAKILEK